MTLTANNLAVSYGANAVLKGLNFSLEMGARKLILGKSGSGKSTLLNVICGLKKPDSGEVTLDNELICSAAGLANSDKMRRDHMGIVFQSLHLVSALSIKKNLKLAQRLQSREQDDGLLVSVMERLGIVHLSNARPHEISKGEAQRAAIARAIVTRPKLLIADEPTSALDAENTDTVARLLIELAEETQASLLIATHDERLHHLFSDTMVIDKGVLSA